MTAQPVEPVAPAGFPRLDPKTPQGQQAAKQAGVIAAGVINRLRREGKPVPGDPSP